LNHVIFVTVVALRELRGCSSALGLELDLEIYIIRRRIDVLNRESQRVARARVTLGNLKPDVSIAVSGDILFRGAVIGFEIWSSAEQACVEIKTR
jgi:hypothetical protein